VYSYLHFDFIQGLDKGKRFEYKQGEDIVQEGKVKKLRSVAVKIMLNVLIRIRKLSCISTITPLFGSARKVCSR